MNLGIQAKKKKNTKRLSVFREVWPDNFYKMQILKDEAKSNKTGKNELDG